MDKTQPQRVGELTPDALDALKAKTPSRIYLIEVTDGDTIHCLYLRRPDFDTLKAVSRVAKTDELESSRVLLANCRVAGSEAILQDGVLIVAAASAIGELITSAKATLKNV